MDRDEMLEKLGVSYEEFRDLLAKLSRLYASLNHRQQVVVRCSMPTLVEAAATFGPDVSAADLERFLEQAWPSESFSPINIKVCVKE
jgi:hypothetical protein